MFYVVGMTGFFICIRSWSTVFLVRPVTLWPLAWLPVICWQPYTHRPNFGGRGRGASILPNPNSFPNILTPKSGFLRNPKKDVRKAVCNKTKRKTKNEVAGWRVHGPKKDGNKRMERQSKGSRGLEAHCRGGQGPLRAVAPSKKNGFLLVTESKRWK